MSWATDWMKGAISLSRWQTARQLLPDYTQWTGSKKGEILTALKATFSAKPAVPNPVYFRGPAHGLGTDASAFAGAVLTPSGMVVLVPLSSPHIGLVDPRTGAYTAVNGGFTGSAENVATAFASGCLLPNGTVLFVPLNSAKFGIFDPMTQTYTSGPAHGEGATSVFAGCSVMPNGKVAVFPLNADYIGEYTSTGRTTGTYARGNGGAVVESGANTMMEGGALHPNGKIYPSPMTLDYIPTYDTQTSLYARGNGGSTHNQTATTAWEGAVLCRDGRIAYMPFGATRFGLYDPETDTFNGNGPLHGEAGSNVYSGGVLMPDGRIFPVPRTSLNYGVFDPEANSGNGTYTSLGAHGEDSSGSFVAGVLCPNGIIVLAPLQSAYVGFVQTWCTPLGDPVATCLHPAFNRW